MFVKGIVRLSRPSGGASLGRLGTSCGTPMAHLVDSIVDLHFYVQKLLYYSALISVCG